NPQTRHPSRARTHVASSAVIISSIKTGNVTVRDCPHTAANFVCSMPYQDEIHVWHALTAVHQLDLDTDGLLSRDEHARMMRFRFDNDRNNFLFCRSMLTMLLASYLGTFLVELRFAYSAHWKPSLAEPSVNLQFIF